MSQTTLIILSLLLAVVIVAVLAAALIRVRQDLESASRGLAALAGALAGVESEHLRPLEPAVTAINAQFEVILGALPGIARKAAPSRRGGPVILEWLLDVVLLLVVAPVVVVLLRGVLTAANRIVPSVNQIAAVAQAGSSDLDATVLLLTTQDQAKHTSRRRPTTARR